MSDIKAAWWRGKKVRQAGHELKWYRNAIASYTDVERAAFFSGYCNQPLELADEATQKEDIQ